MWNSLCSFLPFVTRRAVPRVRALALAALTLAALLSLACGDGGPAPSPDADADVASAGPGGPVIWIANADAQTLKRVDPVDGADLAGIMLPGQPTRVAYCDGSLWATLRDGRLLRVDPGAREIVAEIAVGASPSGLACAFGSVWVADDKGNAEASRPFVARVEPASNAVAAVIPVGDANDRYNGLAPAADGVWVLLHNAFALARIDPEQDVVAETLPLGKGGGYGWGELALAGDSIWVADQYSDALHVLTRSPLAVATTTSIGEAWDGALAAGPGALFLAEQDADRIHVLDPRDGTERTAIATADRPGRMRVFGSRLYVSVRGMNGPLEVFDATSGAPLETINGVWADDFAFME